MNLLQPLGLLGLIGIPILILIYIIKSKYREYVVSSTYIWKLSEKFVKKKSPLSKISGLLSLILQILTVLFLSFALAHPIISISNAKNYLFIVDNSASMNIDDRIMKAKNEMIDMVYSSNPGCEYTIILANEEASIICERENDKDKVVKTIKSISATFEESEVTNGVNAAQAYFIEDSSKEVILFTDKKISEQENIKNIKIKNMNEDEMDSNASINSLSFKSDETTTTFNGQVISYYEDKAINLQLFLDDTFESEITINCLSNQSQTFTFNIEHVNFNTAKVIITNEDDLMVDNEYILYNHESISNYNILLISENPFYLKSILSVLGETSIDIYNEYNPKKMSGYDLYVFDSVSVSTLPTDGAIWLFNIDKNIDNAGFVVQGFEKVTGGATLKLTNDGSETYSSLTTNITNSNISVAKYMKYGVYSSFTTIMSYNSYPMIFAGINENKNRQVMFSFDLHDSNLPLLLEFVILFKNMIDYSIPSICNQNQFVCGEEISLNVLPNCESIKVYSPSNIPSELPLQEGVALYELNEVGTYSIEYVINGQTKKFKLYASYPINEQNVIEEIEYIDLVGSKTDATHKSEYDIQWILFFIVLVLAILEWEVYIYEQRYVR